jgi:hypothetical protein
LLKELARYDAVHVFISITPLNTDLAAKMEGPYAEQAHEMFHVFRERLGFGARMRDLRTEHFRRPGEVQMTLGV